MILWQTTELSFLTTYDDNDADVAALTLDVDMKWVVSIVVVLIHRNLELLVVLLLLLLLLLLPNTSFVSPFREVHSLWEVSQLGKLHPAFDWPVKTFCLCLIILQWIKIADSKKICAYLSFLLTSVFYQDRPNKGHKIYSKQSFKYSNKKGQKLYWPGKCKILITIL